MFHFGFACLLLRWSICICVFWPFWFFLLQNACSYFLPIFLLFLFLISLIHFSLVQLLSRVRLFATPRTAARQASLSITNSQSLLKLMSIESVMLSKLLILYFPLLLLSIFPAMESFPVSQLFASGIQRIGISVSASVLPMKTQD